MVRTERAYQGGLLHGTFERRGCVLAWEETGRIATSVEVRSISTITRVMTGGDSRSHCRWSG